MRTGAAGLMFALTMASVITPVLAQPSAPLDSKPSAPAPAPPTAAPAIPAARQTAELEIQLLRNNLQRLVTANDLVAAERAARDALLRAEALFDHNDGWIGLSAETLGQILFRLGRPADAIPHLLRSLEIVSIHFGVDHERYKRAVATLVDSFIAARAGEDAKRLYDRVLIGAVAMKRAPLVEAHYRNDYGLLLRRLGDNAGAEAQFRLALAIRETHLPRDHFDTANTLTNLAGILRISGRFAEAETAYVEALASMRASRGDRDTNVGILLDNLGTIYGELGRLADAERVQREAVQIFDEKLGPDHRSTSIGLSNLAALYQRQGRLDEARVLFERVLATYRRTLDTNNPSLAITLDNLGGLYRDLGRLPDALAARREALQALRRALPDTHPNVATAYSNLAATEVDLGNDSAAEPLFRRAIELITATFGPGHHGIGIANNFLGGIYMRLRKPVEAADAYGKSVAIIAATLGPEHRSIIEPSRALAGISLGFGRPVEALVHSRRALRAEIASRGRETRDAATAKIREAGDGPFHGALTVAWHGLEAKVEAEAALAAEAFETAQWITLSSAGTSLAALGMRLAAADPALGVLVRERQDLQRQWAAVDADIVRSVAAPPDRRDIAKHTALRSAIAGIEARSSEIDGRLAREFPAFAALNNPKPLPLVEAQRLLKPDEALIQIVPGSQHVFVWLATRETLRWQRLPLSLVELTRRVDTLRCGLDTAQWAGDAALKCLDRLGRAPDNGLLPFDGPTAHSLWRDLLEPFADEIIGRKLLTVASGPLTRLPLQLLLTEAASTTTTTELAAAPWVLKRHAVVVLPAVSSLATLRRAEIASRANRRFLGVANPILHGPDGTDRSAETRLTCPAPGAPASRRLDVADVVSRPASLLRGGSVDVALVRGLAPLPETTDEVCAVARGLGADVKRDVLLGPAANEKSIKVASKNGDLASYAILHFATHGLVSGELEGLGEPALVLSPPDVSSIDDDGLLTASEIAELKLDANVVVLSACNTAAGGGTSTEALSGLARAFFYAGSRSLLVSHWPVDSDAAVKLVGATFERLQQVPGIGRSEALRLAMLRLLSDPSRSDYAHPQVWAPFVVVGEDGGAEGLTSQIPADLVPGTQSPASGQRPQKNLRASSRAPKPAVRQPGKAAPPGGHDPQAIFRDQR